MNARMRWPLKNVICLEPGGPDPHTDASTWVHADVREFEDQYKNYRYFVTTQEAADGELLVDIAKRGRLFALVNCKGLTPANTATAALPSSPQPGPTPSTARTPPATSTHQAPRAPSAPATPPTATRSSAAATPQVTPSPPLPSGGRQPIASCRLSDKGLEFIKGFEEYIHIAKDVAGKCTIGYGHQISTQSCATIRTKPEFAPYADGISEPQALAYLKVDKELAERAVRKRVQVPLYQHEYDALVSLIFSLGSEPSAFDKCPSLIAKLNTRDYVGCCDEFADITKSGGNVMLGLVARRKAEMNMFHNNVYDSRH